jgi:hypothetical protein
MLTNNQVNSIRTPDGFRDVATNKRGLSVPFKAEALLGFGPFRIGYQFLYNYATPAVSNLGFTPDITDAQSTTYFNYSKTHIFGHYALVELSVLNFPHFGLVPGIAAGTFTGYRVDKTTGERVSLSETTTRRFSIGFQLNAEIKFGRFAIVFGPNYYLFSLNDKANFKWREYQHFLGGDLGLRINLLKP